jgi:hypothetical protein
MNVILVKFGLIPPCLAQSFHSGTPVQEKAAPHRRSSILRCVKEVSECSCGTFHSFDEEYSLPDPSDWTEHPTIAAGPLRFFFLNYYPFWKESLKQAMVMA